MQSVKELYPGLDYGNLERPDDDWIFTVAGWLFSFLPCTYTGCCVTIIKMKKNAFIKCFYWLNLVTSLYIYYSAVEEGIFRIQREEIDISKQLYSRYSVVYK
jgi:hypothetical protein